MHTIFKRTLLFSLAFTLFFSAASAAFADTATLTYERLWPLKARLTAADGYNFQVPCNKKFLDGEIAFCLEPLLEVVNGGTYTAQTQFPGISAATLDKLERIVYLAWESSPQAPEDYFAASLLIWEALGYEVTSTTGFESLSYSARREAVREAERKLLLLPSFHGQEITLRQGESITLQDDNQVFADMYAASEPSGSTVQYTRTAHSLSLTGLKAGTETLYFQKVPDDYVGTSIFWETPTAGKQNLATLKLRTSIQAALQVRVSEPTGNIVVSKTDESGQALCGVEITLCDGAGAILDAQRTDESGQVTFAGFAYGAYFIEETEALPGYVPEEGKHPLELTGAECKLTLVNQAIRVSFAKRDRLSEAPCPGAELELQRDGQTVYTWTSEEAPFVVRALPAGTYQVIERTAPAAYHLMAPFEITVQPVAEEQPFLLYNEAVSGSVRVMKRDKADGSALSGAVISLYREDGTLIDEQSTGPDGWVLFEGLSVGAYYYIEKQAPLGYAHDDAEHALHISREQPVLEHTLENEKIYGQAHITKLDVSTQQALPDTLIAIFSAQDVLIEEKRTDSEGRASFRPLPVGDYYFLEREAPLGYTLNPDKHTFSVNTQGQIIEAVLEDERILVQPSLQKLTLDGGAPLAGAKIALFREDGTLIEAQQTDEKGLALFGALPVGRYYFLEQEAPEGYQLNPDKHPFAIEHQDQIVQSTMYDAPIEGELRLLKIDADSGLPLAGARFEIAQGDALIAQISSDAQGEAVLRLAFGSYTVREISAPDGYTLAETEWPVVIRTQHESVQLVLKNDREAAKLPRTGVSHAGLYLGTLSMALGVFIHRKRR